MYTTLQFININVELQLAKNPLSTNKLHVTSSEPDEHYRTYCQAFHFSFKATFFSRHILLKLPGRDGSWMGDYTTCGSCHLVHAARFALAPRLFQHCDRCVSIQTRLGLLVYYI